VGGAIERNRRGFREALAFKHETAAPPDPLLIVIALGAVGANLGIDALRGWTGPTPWWQYLVFLPFLWLWLWVWKGFRRPGNGGPKPGA
jgi:hypothetical protein